MKFVFVFYIVLWQTTLSFADPLKCYHCNIIELNKNDYYKCLANTEAKYSTQCPNKNVCYISYDANTSEVKDRRCLKRWKIEYFGYTLNDCKIIQTDHRNDTHCTYDTNNSNKKTFQSQIDSLTDLKCITCSGNDVDCLLRADTSHSQDCTGKDFICITVLNSIHEIIYRYCENPYIGTTLHPIPLTEPQQFYSIGECKRVNEKVHCACNTTNCNNKKASEMILPAGPSPSVINPIEPDKPAVNGLMCYKCDETMTADCLNLTNALLEPCQEPGQGLGDDYYCTTVFVNDKAALRDCSSKMDLPNYDNPLKCHINKSTNIKSCACRTSKCNDFSSFSTEMKNVSENKELYIGILIPSVVLSLVKWQVLN